MTLTMRLLKESVIQKEENTGYVSLPAVPCQSQFARHQVTYGDPLIHFHMLSEHLSLHQSQQQFLSFCIHPQDSI